MLRCKALDVLMLADLQESFRNQVESSRGASSPSPASAAIWDFLASDSGSTAPGLWVCNGRKVMLGPTASGTVGKDKGHERDVLRDLETYRCCTYICCGILTCHYPHIKDRSQ